MKNNEEKKQSNFKIYYKKFKEAWADPRKKAGIKLLGYLIFFIILFTIAGINSRTNNKDVTINNNEQTQADKYSDKQKDLINNKYTVNYVLKVGDTEYRVNGVLDSGAVTGYIEYSDTIKKIIINKGTIYEVKNDENTILETTINSSLLDLDYILDLIKKNQAIISVKDSGKEYSYRIATDELLNIKVLTNDSIINRITIQTNEETEEMYELNFSE